MSCYIHGHDHKGQNIVHVLSSKFDAGLYPTFNYDQKRTFWMLFVAFICDTILNIGW